MNHISPADVYLSVGLVMLVVVFLLAALASLVWKILTWRRRDR